MRVPSRLPPELIRHIIAGLIPDLGGDDTKALDGIDSSKKDLCSCSLVCHTWQEITQFFLFADVLCKFSDGTSDTGRLAQFRDFLQASPAICACVRKLTLIPKPKPPPLPGRLPPRVPVYTQLCLSILSLLPHLHTILFHHIHLTEPSLSHSNLRVKTIEIHYNGRSYAPFEGVLWLIGMFDEIGMLRIGSRFISSPSPDSTEYDPKTKVSALWTDITNYKSARGASDLIQAVRHENALRSFHMNTMLYEREWVDLCSLMKSGVGAELAHLGFTVDWPVTHIHDPEHQADVDRHGALLILCPRLKSFALDFCFLSDLGSYAEDVDREINGTIWSDISRLIPSLPLTVQSTPPVFLNV